MDQILKKFRRIYLISLMLYDLTLEHPSSLIEYYDDYNQ